MFKIPRTILALVLGVLFTVMCGLGGALLGIVFKIPCTLLGCQNPVRYIINLWAFLVTEICFRSLMSIEIVIDNKFTAASKDEVVVCYGNHPSTLGTAIFTRFVQQYFSRDILTVAKRELLWNPFLGWPLWSLDTAIFINRSSSLESTQAIDTGITNRLRVPSAVIIFPDMHRPTRELIARDREDFKKKIPGVASWLKYTLVPRSGGSYILFQGVRGHRVRVVDVTMFCDHIDDSVWKIFGLFGAKFHITAKEDFEVLNLEREALNLHFNTEWKNKNEQIDRGTIK